MPNLDNLIRWQEYAPDIGENRNAPRPFTVLVAVGLTKKDLATLAEVSDAPLFQKRGEGQPEPTEEEYAAALGQRVEALAAALSDFVRMGPEPLFVAGEAIDSLQKLLMLYTRVAAGASALLELVTTLRWFNTAGGSTELFFARLSGGSVGTTQGKRAAR